MAIEPRSGIAASYGFKLETTVGTPVTVDTFLPFVSESIKRSETFTESAGILAGRRLMQSSQWDEGNVMIGGDIQLELYTTSIRSLLTAMMGTETGGTLAYTYTPADLYGDALTVQIGRPDTAGTINAFTYGGMKVASWEIACAAGEIATMGLTLMGCLGDESTGTALAAPSYAAGLRPIKFSGANIVVAGGTLATVKQFTLSGDNSLEERRYLGSRFSSEPIESDLRKYTGALSAQFDSLTAYQRYVNHTEATLVATLGSGTSVVRVTANIRFDGETPNVGGRAVLEQALPFTVIAPGTLDSQGISISYTL
tara:strand:- start:3098 stop:4033 length:936 start_codon:yes stop_codon:yes gene_type:complete